MSLKEDRLKSFFCNGDISTKIKEKKMGKVVKKVCKCENCGNESEMIITCSLPPSPDESDDTAKGKQADHQSDTKRVKGTATCSHCGSEADMWIDL
jgi:hypothetical protein